MPRDPRHLPRPLLGAAVLAHLALLGAVSLTQARYAPPEPRPADAPAARFSATRARARLGRVLEEGVPHRVGSPANARVRERLVKELEELGLEPEVRRSFTCGPKGTCAEVANVLARVPGREETALLLMAHYDSAAVAPGASDDGTGVASLLEAGRALREGPALRHPVLLLFTDGEEGGLLGAEAFARELEAGGGGLPPVAGVINLDGRGTTGPSILYETGPGNLPWIRAAAAGLEQPVGNSLFGAFYRRMPTDTDFSPFRSRGVPGLNFAFVGDIFRYHTPLDTLEALDLGTLQHQGQNALQVVRALQESPLPDASARRAVFLDLHGAWLLWWPSWLSPLLALATLLLLRALRGPLEDTGNLPAEARVLGHTFLLLVLLLGALGGAAVTLALQAAGQLPGWFVAHPLPGLLALWGAGIGAVGVTLGLLAPTTGFWGLWYGVWSTWTWIALLLGLLAPAASGVFLLPPLAAALSGTVARRTGVLSDSAECSVAALVPALVAIAVWVPVLWFQFQAVGFAFKAPVATLTCLALSGLAPLLVLDGSHLGRAYRRGGALLIVVGAAWGSTFPAYTRDAPRRASVLQHQEFGEPDARLLVGAFFGDLPPQMRLAARFGEDPVRPFPWSTLFHVAHVASAPALEAPAPELEVLAVERTDAGRRVRARLRSARGAPLAGLLLPPDAAVEAVRIAGAEARSTDGRAYDWGNGWQSFSCLALPLEGVEVVLELAGETPVRGVVFDRSLEDRTEAMEALIQARPPSAVPSHYGDGTMITRKVQL